MPRKEVRIKKDAKELAKTPLRKINPDEVLSLAKIGASIAEIAAFMGVSYDVIHHNFQKELEQGKASMKLSLRRAQLRSALETGNPSLLIWLGKNMLGQTDQLPEYELKKQLEDYGKKQAQEELKNLDLANKKIEEKQ
jgi:hypothetical protein